jgi:hypothetical protein
MHSTDQNILARGLKRITGLWTELDYAQRRLLEIRTGVPFGAREHGLVAEREIEQLEAMFARDGRASAARGGGRYARM